jgi:hypothetical protein
MITWSISGMSSPRAARSVHTKNCCSPSRNLSRFACLEVERGWEKKDRQGMTRQGSRMRKEGRKE